MDVKEQLSPLHKSEYIVTSEYTPATSYKITPIVDGYSFYGIFPSIGKTPDILSGRFSSARAAITALQSYLETKKPKKKIEKKVLKNAATDESDNSEQLREGASN